MPKYTTESDLELLGELGVDTAFTQPSQRSTKEERIIAGFEEIERFVEVRVDGLSMGRSAISSSGSTRCGWIACGTRRNVAPS